MVQPSGFALEARRCYFAAATPPRSKVPAGPGNTTGLS